MEGGKEDKGGKQVGRLSRCGKVLDEGSVRKSYRLCQYGRRLVCTLMKEACRTDNFQSKSLVSIGLQSACTRIQLHKRLVKMVEERLVKMVGEKQL